MSENERCELSTLKMRVPLAAALCRECLQFQLPKTLRALASEVARQWHTTLTFCVDDAVDLCSISRES